MAEVLGWTGSFVSCRIKSVGGCASLPHTGKGFFSKGGVFCSELSRKPLGSLSSGHAQGSSWLQPKVSTQWKGRRSMKFSLQVYAAQTCIPRTMRWWDKGLAPNMREVHSAQELIDSLVNAGDKLVVLHFFSPGCGACRSLHPKICQLAEMNSDVEFVKVNHEENKSLSYSLNIHVLPFFQFYRGTQGCLCSFSCTNGTINKFKDALAKHNTPRCSIGPPMGLGERELLALSENKSLSFNMPVHVGSGEVKEEKIFVGSDKKLEDLVPIGAGRKLEDSAPLESSQKSDDRALIGAH